ncbi:MAG TPA: hypothetical protein ENJ09_10850 [Planctomycetes bacterium]|nr:hypothetical protein [Planctomycetota bacterium]
MTLSPPERRSRTALLLAALLLGWVVFDLALLSAVGAPDWALELAPRSFLLVVGAGCLGLALSRWRSALAVLLALLAVASLAPKFLDLALAESVLWIPRVALLLLALLALASRLRLRASAAFGAGLSAAGAVSLWRMGSGEPVTAVLFGAGLLLSATSLLPAARLRVGAHGIVLLLVFLFALRTHDERTMLRRPDLPPAPVRARSGPNLLLVVLDTVRADHLAPYGAARPTTPNLDRFVSEHATRYANARSTSSWTLPSHASLLTGLYPDEHGATRPRPGTASAALTLQAWPAQRLSEDATTLAELLRERGYRTGAIVGNTSFLRHEYGLDRGFEHYDDRPLPYLPRFLALAQLGGGHEAVGFLPYRDAGRVSDLALSWLDEDPGRPFFLFLNFMDAHLPCIPPAPHAAAFGGPRPADPRHPAPDLLPLLYDRELRYIDAELDRVLSHLAETGALADTAIVITSDHGEAFGEHGFTAHGWNLFDETIRVPLYTHAPGQSGGALVEPPTSGVDVFPIALSLLGSPPTLRSHDEEGEGMIGQLYMTERLVEIWADRGAQATLDAVAWLDDDRKWIVSSSGTALCFDLAADPNELHPLPLSPEERERARARAKAWWAAHPPAQTSVPEWSDEAADRLRDLGYAGDQD